MRCISAAALLAIAAATGALAQQSGYGQCGGIGWSGPTTCKSGWSCEYSNPYFSQCLPVTSTKSPSTILPTPTPTPTATVTATTTPTSTTCVASKVAGALMPRSSGPPIHALDGWAKDTWLQKSKISSDAILGPANSKGWYLPSNAIRLIYNGCTQFLYLNVLDASTSYKPLSFDIAVRTTTWSYNGGDDWKGLPGGQLYDYKAHDTYGHLGYDQTMFIFFFAHNQLKLAQESQIKV